VSGAAGHRRISTDTNGPDMRNGRDRQRRFCTRVNTKPLLMTEPECRPPDPTLLAPLLHEEQQTCRDRRRADLLAMFASGLFGSLNLRTPFPQA
jgi:hypothetical protein